MKSEKVVPGELGEGWKRGGEIGQGGQAAVGEVQGGQ